MSPEEKDSGDYSTSATTLRFDRPLPLLRGPLPVDPLDHPSAGPSSSPSGITLPGFPRNVLPLGGTSRRWTRTKEECEVREMNECLVVAKGKSAGFDDNNCRRTFMNRAVRLPRRAEKFLICVDSVMCIDIRSAFVLIRKPGATDHEDSAFISSMTSSSGEVDYAKI
ncbi:hypothetical protein MLD38_026438 [Melastoma candidum]|uniref:Uncharacterized protein n=1 Tax=Melastoma candidum TaxID=119954 RepID=A0ACB9NZ34_9MYRT|nr:hypothetical protein MLD38_026438 [Melastoma candidum]